MRVPQISVFLENRKGRLREACTCLAEAKLNLVALSLADTTDFGILRVIVEDTDRALAVLKKSNFTTNKTDVLAIEVSDQPGGLARLLEVVDEADLNVEYMYAFNEKRADQAVLIFRFNDPDRAAEALGKAGVNVLSKIQLFDTVGSGQ
jgi:hypothetical protein